MSLLIQFIAVHTIAPIPSDKCNMRRLPTIQADDQRKLLEALVATSDLGLEAGRQPRCPEAVHGTVAKRLSVVTGSSSTGARYVDEVHYRAD